MLKHPSFNSTIKPKTFSYLYQLLMEPWCSNTLCQRVEKLLPGHLMRVDARLITPYKIEKFYEIPFEGQFILLNSEEELIEELDQKLTAAVQATITYLMYQLAFYLSGGVDSSLIVAIARKLNPAKELRCFTINSGSEDSFEGFENDLHYARLVAKHLNVSLCEIDVQANIIEHFDKMIWHLDEPQADPAPLNVMLICQQAQKEGYKVLLGGTGGDDLFSGYRRHQVLTWEKYIVILPQIVRNIISASAKKLKNSNPNIRRVKKLLLEIKKTPYSRMIGYFSWISWHSNKSLFTPEIQAKINAEGYHPDNYMFKLLDNIPEEKNILNQCLYLEMRSFLPDHNLNYTDKMSMSAGVESRIPFLDLELVNFSTKIPPQLKLKGKTAKYILKKVTERYLPKEVVYRSKVGFGAPIRKWITNDLTEKIDTDLSEENVTKRGIFNYPAVKRLIVNTKAGKIDGSYIIWSLLAIESWMKQFVDKK